MKPRLPLSEERLIEAGTLATSNSLLAAGLLDLYEDAKYHRELAARLGAALREEWETRYGHLKDTDSGELETFSAWFCHSCGANGTVAEEPDITHRAECLLADPVLAAATALMQKEAT